MQPVQNKPRVLVWHNILFFGITTLVALTLTPLYGWLVGYTASDWALFWFMSATTMMATTFGYHRLFAHKAFKAHPAVTFLNLFFGAAAFEQSALTWASQHRDHHRFTDTDRDPYNIKRGFWYAHMGWFLFDRHKVDYDNVKDLSSDRMIRFQHETWIAWAIAAGFVLPLFVGLLTGHFWGALFLGVAARFVFIHQSVFLINSACHMFGRATYKDSETARDSWVCALLTNGEGYHNFHHTFPNDFRNGVRWYQWDPTKWLIGALSKVGLVRDLRKTPEILIVQARVEQQNRDAQAFAHMMQDHPKASEVMRQIAAQHEKLKVCLKGWEAAFVEYTRLRQSAGESALREASYRMAGARQNFFKAYKQWVESIRPDSLMLVVHS